MFTLPDPPRRIYTAPFDFGEHAAPNVLAGLVPPLSSVPPTVRPGAVVPEAEPLVAPLPDTPPGVATDKPSDPAPQIGVLEHASQMKAPVYDDARAGRIRTAGLVAALIGGGASLLGAGDSPLTALATGVAGGASRGLGEMDDDYRTRSTAYARGISEAVATEAQIADRAAGRAATATEAQANRASADARQGAADAAAETRRQADAARQEARDLRSSVEKQAAAALEARDEGAYVSLATQYFDMDEATARSIVQTYVARDDRAALVQDRDYRLRARGVAASEASAALSAQRFRADRDDEMYDRTHPTPTRTGGARTGVRSPSPAPLMWNGQNLNDPAVEARLRAGGMTPARLAELRRVVAR